MHSHCNGLIGSVGEVKSSGPGVSCEDEDGDEGFDAGAALRVYSLGAAVREKHE